VANGWDGADPVQADDGSGTFYELGEEFTAAGDLTIHSIRVWHGASSNTVVGRRARVWTSAGVELAEAVLTDTLPAGWTTFELDAPVEVQSGTALVVSYGTRQFYGATPGNYPNASADGLLSYTAGVFAESVGTFPTTETVTFYGVDVVYDAGIGGNVAPVVSLAATAAGRTVTATATVEDESPGTVTYRWEFGDGTVVPDGDAVEEHTYAADGLYAILVTVTDVGGLRDSAAVPIVAKAGTPGGMSLELVMTELAARLDTIAKLQVHRAPPKRVYVPAAIVPYPQSITFDQSYGRGSDAMMVPVVVLVSKLNDDGGLTALSELASGFGSRSIKAVLESGVYVSFGTLRVVDAEFDVYEVAGDEYLAGVFNVSVTG
jgi:hypothetical protein